MPTKIDLIGRTFGKLTVKGEADRGLRSKIHWTCLCECGNEVDVAGSNLQSGASQTCGCSLNAEDLSGKLFGNWTVLSMADRVEGKEIHWRCICSCGVAKLVAGSSLRLRRSTSCGCSATTHGLSHAPTYHIWTMLKQRINNTRAGSYKDYGGRGITMDPRWLTFEGFFEDMGERPGRLSIERVNNELGYCKSNCIWADANTQARNKRNNVKVLYRGLPVILKDAARMANIKYTTLYQRLYRSNLPVPEAFGSVDFQPLPTEEQSC